MQFSASLRWVEGESYNSLAFLPTVGGAFEASSYQSVCVCARVCSACTRRHARLCVNAGVCARTRVYPWGAHRFQDSPLQTCRVRLCDHQRAHALAARPPACQCVFMFVCARACVASGRAHTPARPAAGLLCVCVSVASAHTLPARCVSVRVCAPRGAP